MWGLQIIFGINIGIYVRLCELKGHFWTFEIEPFSALKTCKIFTSE